MLGRSSILAAATAIALTSTLARDADACGGCLAPPAENTVVQAHRMALSVAKTQTVLWDQFEYSGAPKEFAWVLPVRPGTKVEISHDEFFAALEAATQPVITAPPQNTGGGGGGGFGCGASATSAYDPGSNSTSPPVQVVNQEVVGPYEVVTLKATDAGALNTWLKDHGYAVPADIQSVIDAYIKEQFDFVALRLLPNKDVNAMQPVRVVTPGADANLPLRMVAAGVGAKVGIILYVIGEGRYQTANYPNLAIDLTGLTWDYAKTRSNYSETVEAALAAGDGRGWFTEYAYPMLGKRDGSRIGYFNFSTQTPLPTLSEAYSTAIKGSKCSSPFPSLDGGAKDSGINDASIDASDDGSVDASTDGGTIDAGDGGSAECKFDDIEVATRGMFPSDVWITRLRANLPKAALSTDLKLEAEPTQKKLDALYRVSGPPAQDPGDGCNAAPQSAATGDRAIVALGLGALALTMLARTARRRRR